MIAESKSRMDKLKELRDSIDGPEVNEDGDPFVEIREEVENSVLNETILYQTVEKSIPNDDFDIQLLEKIRLLELEEEGQRRSVRFSDAPSQSTIPHSNVSDPVSVLKNRESDPGTISNDLIGNTRKNSSVESLEAESAEIVDQTEETFRSPMALEVVEKEFSDDEFSNSSDDDIEEGIQSKDVQIAYHRKRQQFLSAGILKTK
jgi:hypothetical protein